jgi:heme A synthase
MRSRLLAVVAALSVWASVAVGGAVRATASGPACPHGPRCTADALPLQERASIVESSRRAVVALVVVLAGAPLVATRRGRSLPAAFLAFNWLASVKRGYSRAVPTPRQRYDPAPCGRTLSGDAEAEA